jgi:integrase
MIARRLRLTIQVSRTPPQVTVQLAAAVLAAYTGARRGELLYLRWDAVDLDAAEVTFGGSTAVVRGLRVEDTTKGGRSRTVSLDRETVAVLREHRRQQTEERLVAGSAWNNNGGLVFTSRWGEPLYPDTVTALMTKLINQHNKSVTPPTTAPPRPAARPASPARGHTAAGGSPGSRGGRTARPRRPRRDVAGLLPRPT